MVATFFRRMAAPALVAALALVYFPSQADAQYPHRRNGAAFLLAGGYAAIVDNDTTVTGAGIRYDIQIEFQRFAFGAGLGMSFLADSIELDLNRYDYDLDWEVFGALYPFRTGGFFVRGGAGSRVFPASQTFWTFASGYDVRIARLHSVTPFFKFTLPTSKQEDLGNSMLVGLAWHNHGLTKREVPGSSLRR